VKILMFVYGDKLAAIAQLAHQLLDALGLCR